MQKRSALLSFFVIFTIFQTSDDRLLDAGERPGQGREPDCRLVGRGLGEHDRQQVCSPRTHLRLGPQVNPRGWRKVNAKECREGKI